MKKISFLFYYLLIIVSCGIAQNLKPIVIPEYPKTRKTDQVDDYFGTKVADPYRWLENDKSEETSAWVQAQNEVTQKYLSQIPYRSYLKARLTELWNYPRMTTPFMVGNKLFYFRNTGLQNQNVLYTEDKDHPEGVELLDPNKLSGDGTVALSDLEVSKNGKYLAYAVSKSGSDWQQIYVMDIDNRKVLKDEIKWVKFSNIAWQGNGFYYSGYDAPRGGDESTEKNQNQSLFYHQVETSQSKDKMVYEDKDHPLRTYESHVSEDEKYLILGISESTSGNALYYKDLTNEKSGFQVLCEGFKFDNEYVGLIDGKFLIRTNSGDPNYSLILLEPQTSQKPVRSLLMRPDKGQVLESAILVNRYILVKLMIKATDILRIYTLGGESVSVIQLETPGTIGKITGKPGDESAFFTFTSFTFPARVYEYRFADRKYNVKFRPESQSRPEDYVTRQVFFTSKDGTSIPMFITSKTGIQPDGNNPTLLYGYGGFNISITPTYSASRMLFLENGGIYAVANIRGGGEFGESWHNAGIKENKQNVFDDFIAAAEYLIDQKYTNPSKLAISGASNGGLLVGACMTQRPDLFRVALPAVGVMDMLRYQKFTIGWSWKSDYGSSDDEKGFKYIYKYSPLNNIKSDVNYPATLVTTADHDDRVVPSHSFKFISTLQDKYKGANPMLIRIESKAGHGSGKPTTKVIDEAADVWSFVFYNLGMTPTGLDKYNKQKKDETENSLLKDPEMRMKFPKILAPEPAKK